MTNGVFDLLSKLSASTLDEHFESDDPSKWDAFRKRLRSKAFVKDVQEDPRSDRKLKNFSKNLSAHMTSRGPTYTAQGETDQYKIKYHPSTKRYSCSCGNWAYKQAPKSSKNADCKHIKALKEELMTKMAGMLSQVANTVKQQMGTPDAVRYGKSMAKSVAHIGRGQDAAFRASGTNAAYEREMGHKPRGLGGTIKHELHDIWHHAKYAALRGAAAQAILEEANR